MHIWYIYICCYSNSLSTYKWLPKMVAIILQHSFQITPQHTAYELHTQSIQAICKFVHLATYDGTHFETRLSRYTRTRYIVLVFSTFIILLSLNTLLNHTFTSYHYYSRILFVFLYKRLVRGISMLPDLFFFIYKDCQGLEWFFIFLSFLGNS